MNAHPATVLELEDVHTYYGSIHALKGVSLEVREGEIVTLIGANGAGKSTTLRSINGLNHPRNGSIRFEGKEITSTPPHEIVKRGIAQSTCCAIPRFRTSWIFWRTSTLTASSSPTPTVLRG